MHFFIEVDKFTQNSNQKYGPVSGSENTQYRVTSKFTASGNAKAFAVTSGKIFIQQVGTSNSANLVLIPKYIEDVDFTPVQFFIYRGLSLNSFIENNQLLLDTNSNKTDLTSKIRAIYNKFKQQRGQTPTNPGINCIGLHVTSNTNTDSEILEDVIRSCSHLHSVDEGDFIGNFITSGDCGFEVVMQEQFYNYTLGDLRATEKVFSVSAPASGTLEGNEAIAVQRERENILNFIDPAPFFIRYFEYDNFNKLSLDYRNSDSNTIHNLKTLDDNFENIITKFNTSRILYIDIRNELYYSINYFKDNQGATGNDLGKHVSYSFDETNYNGNNNYYKNYWPLLSIDLTNENVLNTFYIKFRKLYNPEPLLYFDYGSKEIEFPLVAHENNKFEDEIPLSPNSQNWSNPFKIGLSSKKYSYYIKLMLIRKEIPETLPNTAIATINYADNIFGPITDLPINFASNGTQWLGYNSKKVINAYDKLGVIGVGDSSLVASSNDVLLISKIMHFYIPVWQKNIPLPGGSGSISTTKAIPIVNGKSINSNILDSLQKYYANEKIEFKVEERIDNNETISTFVVSEIDTPEQLQGSNNYRFTYLMTKSEYDSLVTQSKTDLNHSYLYPTIRFGTYTGHTDEENRKYTTTELKIVGLNNNGITTEYNPNKIVFIVGDIRYMTKDTYFSWLQNLQVFNSKRFSYSELFELIRKVEIKYSTEIKPISTNVLQVPLDSLPAHTVTRMRVHYYGFPGDVKKDNWRSEFKHKWGLGIAFNKGVPNSPYFEPNPLRPIIFAHNLNTIPPSYTTKINLLAGYRIKQLFHKFKDDTKLSIELDSATYTRLLSCQDLKHNDIDIDIGHAFYGLDCLLHQGFQSGDTRPAKPLYSESYSEGFMLNYATDFTGFIGDLASALGDAYLDYFQKGTAITNTVLEKKYNDRFDSSDQYGDVDMFGLKAAWDKLSADPTVVNLRFSDVFQHYYGAVVPSDNHAVPSHYSKRFTIFCKANGLLNSNNEFELISTKKEELIDRIRKFTVFYFHAKFKRRYAVNFSKSLYGNLEEIDIRYLSFGINTDLSLEFSYTHAEFLLVNKFLSFIQEEYENE